MPGRGLKTTLGNTNSTLLANSPASKPSLLACLTISSKIGSDITPLILPSPASFKSTPDAPSGDLSPAKTTDALNSTFISKCLSSSDQPSHAYPHPETLPPPYP